MVSKSEKESGAVIVVAVFVTLALTVLGALASMLTDVELDIARNDRFGKEAFFVTDAGIPLASRVVRDIAMNEVINTSDYPGITLDTNLINEVRNYYEGNASLNDKPTDTSTYHPDLVTSVLERNVGVDIDWRVKKVGPGGSLLGTDGALRIVRAHRDESAKGIVDGLVAGVRDFTRGEGPGDDLAVVVCRVGSE